MLNSVKGGISLSSRCRTNHIYSFSDEPNLITLKLIGEKGVGSCMDDYLSISPPRIYINSLSFRFTTQYININVIITKNNRFISIHF